MRATHRGCLFAFAANDGRCEAAPFNRVRAGTDAPLASGRGLLMSAPALVVPGWIRVIFAVMRVLVSTYTAIVRHIKRSIEPPNLPTRLTALIIAHTIRTRTGADYVGGTIMTVATNKGFHPFLET